MQSRRSTRATAQRLAAGYGTSSTVVAHRKNMVIFLTALYERGILQCKMSGVEPVAVILRSSIYRDDG